MLNITSQSYQILYEGFSDYAFTSNFIQKPYFDPLFVILCYDL